MKRFCKILRIEGILSIRDMNMIVFAIIMPLVVLVIIGVIYGTKPASSDVGYTFLEQSFGALCTISICAGGLMGLPLLVSEYRERKILKRYQVTPVNPGLLLGVHLCIYTLYSVASMITIWIVAKICWGFSMKGSIGLFLVGWILVLISLLSIGMLVGGIAKNSKQASVIASILYFPMLVFSGATLPYEVMPPVMQRVVEVFPMTQGIKILKAATLGQQISSIHIPVIILLVVSILCVVLSIKCFKWE
jgi:ABC-2 type transport system permease protein